MAKSLPPAPPATELDPAAHLASSCSHPEWLVRRWLARFGAEETRALLEWNNRRPSLVLQPARLPLETLQRLLWSGGVGVSRAPHEAGLIVEPCRPADLPGFIEGAFIVQDAAQALVARFADCPPGALVYDACAAPGGKTIALGRVAGRVLAGELRLSRARRLVENLRRAGSGRERVVVASALAPPCRAADLVLLDAPCLGTGTLARHPEARWRVGPDALARLGSRPFPISGQTRSGTNPPITRARYTVRERKGATIRHFLTRTTTYPSFTKGSLRFLQITYMTAQTQKKQNAPNTCKSTTSTLISAG